MRPFEARRAGKFNGAQRAGSAPGYRAASRGRRGRGLRGRLASVSASWLIMLTALGPVAHGQACPSGETARQALLTSAQAVAVESTVAVAAMAASADLGFTLTDSHRPDGPGGRVAVWKRGADCLWSATFEATVPGAALQGELDIDSADSMSPPPRGVSHASGPRAIDEFERVAGDDGVADALHTYALDTGFLLMGPSTRVTLGRASLYLSEHPWRGVWRDATRESSTDSTLLSATGALVDEHGVVLRRYLQIWQYDPKVANWGLRLLWSSEAGAEE